MIQHGEKKAFLVAKHVIAKQTHNQKPDANFLKMSVITVIGKENILELATDETDVTRREKIHQEFDSGKRNRIRRERFAVGAGL
jgi:hypothetical protein